MTSSVVRSRAALTSVSEDFKDDNFRRLLISALFWTTHRDLERMKK